MKTSRRSRTKLSTRVWAAILSALLLVGACPLPAFAQTEEPLPFALQYTAGGEEKTAEASVIGAVDAFFGKGTAYLVSLPYGAEVTSFRHDTAQQTTYGSASASTLGSLTAIEDQYVENMAMRYPTDEEGSYKAMWGYLVLEDETAIPAENVKGFAITARVMWPQAADVIIVQISTKEAGADAGASAPWDGSADTSWYNAEDTAFTLTTAEQLAGLAAIANGKADGIAGTNFAGKTITLGKDILLNDDKDWTSWDNTTEGLHLWDPISINAYRFAGTFDGAGHVVRGLYINTDENFQGLFGFLGVDKAANTSGSVKNLTLESGYIYTTGSSVGGIVGYMNSDIGGMTEALYPTVENCGNKATVVSGAALVPEGPKVVMIYVGGIAGNFKMGKILHSFNAGDVSHSGENVTTGYIGGIAGGNQGFGIYENCYNTGSVTALGKCTNEYDYYVGGISGGLLLDTFYNCYNTGAVQAPNDPTATFGQLTGYAGQLNQDEADVLNCYYLAGGSVPGIGYTDDLITDGQAKALSEAELKAAANRLGSAYRADADGVNGGYPVLAWQTDAVSPTPWDGSVDTSWYNAADTAFTLTTAEQLAGLAAIVNGTADGIEKDAFAGKTLALGADIALNDDMGWKNWSAASAGLHPWTPIGNKLSKQVFSGVFDGRGHKITGLYITNTVIGSGLFGYVTDGTIKNLLIKTGYITSTKGFAGAFVANLKNGRVENCGTYVHIETAGGSTAGIAGLANGSVIHNCFNAGSVTVTHTSTLSGGVLVASIGGVVGKLSNAGTIENCYNAGDLTVTSNQGLSCVGGVLGIVDKGAVRNCYNTGTIALTVGDKAKAQNNGCVIGNIGGININYPEDLADDPTLGAVVSNCYSLACGDLPLMVSPEYGLTGGNARFVDGEELKSSAMLTALGAAYEPDRQTLNGGYPVLAWQNVFDVPDVTQENTVPRRVEGVPAQEEIDTDAGGSYTVDLSQVFMDAEKDPLTYYVDVKYTGRYEKIDGNTYTFTLPEGETRVYLVFTAHDGSAFGSTYTVILHLSLEAAVVKGEAAAAGDAYYTEKDYWNGVTEIGYQITDGTKGFYAIFRDALANAKAVLAKGNASASEKTAARNKLLDAMDNLMPKTVINASLLHFAVKQGNQVTLADYTEVSHGSFEESLAAAKALYADGKVLELAVTAENQTKIDRAAQELRDAIARLVPSAAYQNAYDAYRSRKDEAADLLALCDPAGFHAADYTADSWQAFTAAYDDLKADLAYKIEGDGGRAADWNMVKNFVSHMNALQNARNNLVSDRDITVSFSYINNFAALYPALRQEGTDVYDNGALTLERGATTLYSAIETAGLRFDKRGIWRSTGDGMGVSDGAVPVLTVYVNDVHYGTIPLNSLASGQTTIQLHDGDRVKLVRIPTPIVKAEVSSGYDTTAINYSTTNDASQFKDSIATITIDSLPTGAKVGDKAGFTASVKGSYATNLHQVMSAENLSLFVSGPSATKTLCQSLTKTVAITGADGKLTYIFTEPGWYTVAMLNATQETYTFTNVFGEITYGSYGSVYAGDFALVYIAPAEDENALIAAQRTENLQRAEAYFNRFHAYDFSGTGYAAFTDAYQTLVANQNGADTFKKLVDGFNADYAAMTDLAKQYTMNHEELIGVIREKLRYIPQDLSKLDYTYKAIVNTIKVRYGALNDYQKSLFSKNERTLLEAIGKLDANALYTPDKITVQVAKDAGVELPETNGNLASAPNENRVFVVSADGSMSETYYKFTTNGMLYNGTMEPSCVGMTAYPGNLIRVRRIITQSEESYWLAYSLDGESWELMSLVDGGAGGSMVMLKAEFTLPKMEGNACTIRYKAVSKTVYEEMKLGADSPEMALEEAKTAYKAALTELFNAYDPANYTEDDFIDIRDAKNKGLENIEKAKEVSFALKAFNAAAESMRGVPLKRQVHVVVRNDTYSKAAGAAWDGVLVDTWVTIDDSSTMMSCIQTAVEGAGYTGKGFDSGYISDIQGVGEFGGGSGSGWMGTLNDWFTNEGFSQFTVANGKLSAGDLICAEYTCKYGADIRGGVEGNEDTTLYTLGLTNGTLTPVFDKGTVKYLLTLDEDAHTTRLDFSANNRSFQVRAYRNEYTPSAAAWITSGDTIHVQNGDVLYIGVGERTWASMGKADPTVYTIVIVDGSGAAETLIAALPQPEALTYADKADVERAHTVYQSLTAEQREALSDELKEKVAACAERMQSLVQTLAIANRISALPSVDALTVADKEALDEVKTAFDALTEGQRNDIPLYLVNKLSEGDLKIRRILLEQAKAAALAELNAYKDPAEYSAENQAALRQAIAAGQTAIETATDSAAVQTALANAKAVMDGIPTDKDLVAAALAKAKQEAKAALDGYKNPDGYRDAQKAALAKTVADGKAAIDACATKEAVRDALERAKAAMDAIKTAAQLTAEEELRAAVKAELNMHLKTLLENVPTPGLGTTKGEWSVMELARAGYEVPADYFVNYYARVAQELKDCDGILSATKYTEYSRVILAMTAIGYDPTNIAGYDMVAMLNDMEKVSFQGINGPIWALIALDTGDYDIAQNPNAADQVTRDKLIRAILDAEIEGGGWSLMGAKPDTDITAMALQALAPYKDRADVKLYIERALTTLSAMQDEYGRFGSAAADGNMTVESTAQVIVALTALGIDPKTDSRFVKKNGDAVTGLLLFALADGGFKHVAEGEYNDMATDQGIYALIAYDRFLNGKTALYDMTDVAAVLNPDQEAADAILAAAKIAAKTELDSYKNAADYREAEKAALAKAIADGEAAIDAADTVDEVNAALAAAKKAMDAIKTDAQLKAEEEDKQDPSKDGDTAGDPHTDIPKTGGSAPYAAILLGAAAAALLYASVKNRRRATSR